MADESILAIAVLFTILILFVWYAATLLRFASFVVSSFVVGLILSILLHSAQVSAGVDVREALVVLTNTSGVVMGLLRNVSHWAL